MGRAIDLLITYRLIKLLTTPFEQQDAYKLGIIDKDGKVLRKAKQLKTPEEKDSYTLLHRFVFNLKRLINVIPGGKSKFGTYAAALGLLLREDEEKKLNRNDLENTLYKYLKDNKLIHYGDDLNEAAEFDYLPKGRFTVIEDLTDLEGNHIAEVGDIVYTKFDKKPADKFLGTHLYKVINEDKQKELLVAEDHIERIKF